MKHLIFVAKGIPNAIKSAGDIRALNMLKILRNKYEISVVATSADYGCGDIQAIGCEGFVVSDVSGNIKMLIQEKNPILIIISHWSIARVFINDIRSLTNCQVIVDTIDIEFLRLQREKEYKSLNNQKEIDDLKNIELDVYRKADKIIIVSDQDEEEIKKYGNFRIIRLPCLFKVNSNYQVNEGNNAYSIANWLHKPNIDSVNLVCEKIIPYVDVNFYIVGKHTPDSIKRFASERVIIHGPEYQLEKFLVHMNMLLSPTLYGAGMNGKIGEALAFGIPVVTNDLGAAPFGLIHKESAMIANNENEFIESINELLVSESLRKTISWNSRALIAKFTYSRWEQKFLEEII